MSTQTYQFPHTGTIPGIAGEFHAGLLVDVEWDDLTGIGTVIGTRLANVPTIDIPAPQEEVPEESTIQEIPPVASEGTSVQQEVIDVVVQEVE